MAEPFPRVDLAARHVDTPLPAPAPSDAARCYRPELQGLRAVAVLLVVAHLATYVTTMTPFVERELVAVLGE